MKVDTSASNMRALMVGLDIERIPTVAEAFRMAELAEAQASFAPAMALRAERYLELAAILEARGAQ